MTNENPARLEALDKLLEKLLNVFRNSYLWGCVRKNAYALAYRGEFASKSSELYKCNQPQIRQLIENESIGFLFLTRCKNTNAIQLVTEESFSEKTAWEIIDAAATLDQHVFEERCLPCTANALLQMERKGLSLGVLNVKDVLPVTRPPGGFRLPYKDL